jgi:hypothetical protein
MLHTMSGFGTNWDTERQSYGHDAVAVECAGFGDGIYTDGDPSDDHFCTACTMPPADLAALRMVPAARPTCQTCGVTIYGTPDGPRCAVCARFIARLDADWNTWKEARIAA